MNKRNHSLKCHLREISPPLNRKRPSPPPFLFLMYQTLLQSVGAAEAVYWQGLYWVVCHCLTNSRCSWNLEGRLEEERGNSSNRGAYQGKRKKGKEMQSFCDGTDQTFCHLCMYFIDNEKNLTNLQEETKES